MIEYVIQNIEEMDEDGEALYWSNEYGWSDLSSATVFADTDVDMPVDPCMWVELPQRELGIL